MKILAALLSIMVLAASSGPVLAQRDREGQKAPAKSGQDERRRDSAQQGGERRDMRQERMRPEEREKLRRDIEDANRNMKKR